MRLSKTLGCWALLFALTGAVEGEELYRTVALTGQQAPGLEPGTTFTSFLDSPLINNNGMLSFNGSALFPSGFDHRATWSEGSGTLQLVALENSTVSHPTLPAGVRFGNPEPQAFTDSGATLVAASLRAGGLTGVESSRWSDRTGTLNLDAFEWGRLLTQTVQDDLDFFDIQGALMNQANQIAFRGELRRRGTNTQDNDTGIWLSNPGELPMVVAREGDVTPITADITFGTVSSSVRLNDSGEVAFSSFLQGTGVDSSNDRVLWQGPANDLRMVARTGDPAPDLELDMVFTHVGQESINNADQVAFLGEASDAQTDVSGVWSERAGNLELRALSGEHAVGTEPGVVFENFNAPLINGQGSVAFLAELSGSGVDSSNNVGIWSDGFGEMSLIARTGSQAPGLPDGVLFEDFLFPQVAMNVHDQIAFHAELVGPGVDPMNHRALFALDRDGVLQLVLREGDVIESDGESYTLGSFGFQTGSAGQDGRTSGLNDAGQIGFRSYLGNQQYGMFVTNAVVPEPSTLILALTAGALMLIARLRSSAKTRVVPS